MIDVALIFKLYLHFSRLAGSGCGGVARLGAVQNDKLIFKEMKPFFSSSLIHRILIYRSKCTSIEPECGIL